MRVTQVAIRSTMASDAAGRPSLTPELLAAVGARYSRNNEGLEGILAKVDPTNLDASVDSIFRMIDYGHQSIADMAPVAVFMDGISIFLAYLIWSWCPTAGGQESSTRYIKLTRDGLVDPDLFGIPPGARAEWYDFIDKCFDAYGRALSFWDGVAKIDPSAMRISTDLLSDPSEKAQKQVSRMRRNFAFDRARYFLPLAAKTNMMLVMSARGWVQLCQKLLSHWLPEASVLGTRVQGELALAAPRMVKHAVEKTSYRDGYAAELRMFSSVARSAPEPTGEADCIPSIDIFAPKGISESEMVESLQNRTSRYDFIGSAACRTSVRFSWSAVAIAEIRDLNRHRTGQKECPLVPVGFYAASDCVPRTESFDSSLAAIGLESICTARALLADGQPSFAAWLLLGAQFGFEHTTTLDKFVYEAELRTGSGAHFRYAAHLRATVALLGRDHAALAAAIALGLSEPE
jgi:thymidylate synthase ThyX